jgi:hypothetical protein
MMIASFLNIMTADQWLSNDHEPSAQQQGGANTLELSVQKKIEAATKIEQVRSARDSHLFLFRSGDA